MGAGQVGQVLGKGSAAPLPHWEEGWAKACVRVCVSMG